MQSISNINQYSEGRITIKLLKNCLEQIADLSQSCVRKKISQDKLRHIRPKRMSSVSTVNRNTRFARRHL